MTCDVISWRAVLVASALAAAAAACGGDGTKPGATVPRTGRASPPAAPTGISARPSSFEGRALLVLSDGDMPASAFTDGKLQIEGRSAEGARDALTVLGLPLPVSPPGPADGGSAEVPVSNSVVGPPFGIAASADGRRAYVLQTRGPAPPGARQVKNVFADLPAEAIVTVVDLAHRAVPRILQRVSVGRLAHTLSLSPDGELLAINTDEPGRTLVLREVRPTGEIGRELATIGIDVAGKPVRRVGRVEWHPSGRFLANGLPFQDEIRFFHVNRSGGAVDLRPWGAPVKVGKFPDEGTFTPDGHFYLTTDLNWGDHVPGFFVEAPPGTITAVAFDAQHGQHRVTGRAPTDISPEGIAISPDGRFVVTGNLTRSYLPWTDPRLLDEGSLDLLELDADTGQLHARHRVPIHGVLPEGLVFDASGHYVAATVYDRFDPRRRRGAVEVFRLERGSSPRLERTSLEIEVPPGPHTLLLIP